VLKQTITNLIRPSLLPGSKQAMPMTLNLRNVPTHIFSMLVIISLLYGWFKRDSNYITAESGAGYALGIIGGSLMLILLMYPISKRIQLLTRLLPLRYWFGVHMMFGVLGPLMILFHSNFQLGSINSTVALGCMLIVASSGLIGRYIYTRIHHGLYGSKIQMNELRSDLASEHQRLSGEASISETLQQQLMDIEKKHLAADTGIIASIINLKALSASSRVVREQLASQLSDQPSVTTAGSATTRVIDRYFSSLRRITVFRLYERLFSLWHILHLPLFIMMIITAIIHIFAVHLY
jgi:DNA-binding phage protein